MATLIIAIMFLFLYCYSVCHVCMFFLQFSTVISMSSTVLPCDLLVKLAKVNLIWRPSQIGKKFILYSGQMYMYISCFSSSFNLAFIFAGRDISI